MTASRTDPHLLAVARAERPADLILADARVIDVFNRRIERASVAVAGGRIAGVGPYENAERVIDLGGAYLAPGFIDAHMHDESTMLLPPAFAASAGLTWLATDYPHLFGGDLRSRLGVPAGPLHCGG